MPKRWNVSGHDLVVDWDEPVVHHGDCIEGEDADLPPVGGDWSDDPKDAQRSAVAGASVLTDEEKAAYTAPEKPGRKPRGDGDAPPPEPAADAPADTKES